MRVRLDGSEAFSAARARELFELRHQRLYGHVQPEGLVRISALRVVAEGLLPEVGIPGAAAGEGAPSPSVRRRVWIDEARGWREVPVYAGSDLAPGHRVAGPALVEETTTTVFVGADDELEVDGAGNFLIHLPAA